MDALTPAHDDSGVAAIGTVLADRYRIDGVLGNGGMGRVYHAEHTAIGKPVAIKVLHAALGKNREAAIRFQREAMASGRLDHPNIVNVIDFGTLDDGCLYLVMEALEGEDLGQRLDREKRIPWAESLAIMRGVLLGLRHAHDRGVVHRDIKPDNIFLANRDGEGVVKILDFGIAKLQIALSEDQQATRAGITVGTPKYLSPEQAVGSAITPACDVYSCSVVLFEMLVGRAPFVGDDPLALLTAHAGGVVPPFHELAPDLEVPDGLEELVRHGLAKMVADRIGSALEYVQRIDELLRAHGSEVPATPTPARFSATALPFAATAVLMTPPPRPVAPDAAVNAASEAVAEAVAEPSRPRRRATARRLAVGGLLLAGGAAGLFFWHRDRARPAPPVAAVVPVDAGQPPEVPSHPAASSPHPVAAPSHRAANAPHAHARPHDAHDAQLATELHLLRDGATCAQRKTAVAKLEKLHDRSAIPSLERAVARGKVNACLHASAEHAIRTLGAK
jgi:serine/threonine-protein kinase